MTTAQDLTRRLADLLRREHEAMADFLVALAEFDRRRAYTELGFASLFDFLHRELGLSKGAAHFRKVGSELVARFPEVEAALRVGQLCLSSIVELAKVITPENRGEVLPRFFHRSRREAMEVAAALKPVETPPVRDVVAAVRPEVASSRTTSRGAAEVSSRVTPTSRGEDRVLLVELVDANFTVGSCGLSSRSSRLEDRATEARALEPRTPEVRVSERRSAPRSEVTPLSADQFRLHFTVSRRVHEKLQAARDALSHSKPNASLEEILEAGLDLVLSAQAKRKGLVAKPRRKPSPATSSPTSTSSTSDHVPAHVRREVWQRDGGRCRVRLASGEICGSTYQVELGHFPIPRALGGPATVDNLRCECRGPERSPRITG